jgi:transcriptional regulator with XRE-family HTH domain
MRRKWLQEARVSAGLTQAQVSDHLGMSRGMYYCIESGRRRPSPEKARRLGDLLDVDWTKFYEEDDGNDQDER